MRFAILTAVSTKKQAEGWNKSEENKDTEDKESLVEQERKCRDIAISRGWVETGGPYVIPGKSRTTRVNLRDAEAEIPQLHAMLEDAKGRAFDVLMIYDYNRLRDLSDPVAKTLAAYGVQLFSANQPVEPLAPEEFSPYASDSEFMTRGMSSIISKWQIADLRRKYFFGVSARVKRGLPSNRIPYAYQKPPGHEQDKKAVPIPVPSQARVVVEMKNAFLAGQSYFDIRDSLNDRQIPTPQGAKEWHHRTIRLILLNPFYAGKVFFQRRRTVRDPNAPGKPQLVENPDFQMADGSHQALYPWSDYLAIMAEMRRRAKLPRNNRYNFSGLLVCSVCGARLCHDHGVWRCKAQGAKKDHIGMSLSEADALIPRALQRALKDEQPLSTRGSSPRDTAAEIADLEKQRRRIQNFAEREIYDADEAERRMKAINAEIRKLQDSESTRLQQQKEHEIFINTLEQARELLEELPAWIVRQPPRQVNAFLLRLCREIEITPEGSITVRLRK